jgi:hypothetical protein
VIARRTATLRTAAITRINRTRRPMLSHVDQFCSTQLAAFVALCWASWSVGVVGPVDVEGDGEGVETAVDRAGRDTAGNLQA